MPALVAKFLPVLMLLGIASLAVFFLRSAYSEVDEEFGSIRSYFDSLEPATKIQYGLFLLVLAFVVMSLLFR